MGVVIETCIKYPGGPILMTVIDISVPFIRGGTAGTAGSEEAN